jgi:hypothetical protein
MTNELVINGTTYEFNFGMGFLRQVDPMHQQKANGITQNIGLIVEIAKVLDGDITALCGILRMANKGFTPRLEQAEFDKWIEDPATDIEEVFKEVEGFFANSNCCKMAYQKVAPTLAETPTQK